MPGRGIEDEVLAGRKLRHRIIGQTSKENDGLILCEVADLKVKNVFVQHSCFVRKVIPKPEQIDYVHCIAAFCQFWNEN